MGKDKHARGLEALKSLKNRVPAAAPSRPKIIVPPAPAEPDDATLFRREVARVQPLKADDHAELARPRPVPLPRPKTIEIEPEAPRRPVRIDENDPVAVFRAALGDITPIKDFHRVDLSVQRQQASSQIRAMSQTEPPVARIDAEQLHDPVALFRHVAGEVAPLKDRNLAAVERPLPAPLPRKREEDEREVLREALESPLTFEDRLDTGDEAAYLRVGLPRRVLTDLRRGRWVVQGELD
ncbi:MAG: DNA mismatch repair protein MutS, partial [Zoogloea sp.]|nr:DNA mismatch repair protein MutS [Zoogloea sp.]